jgi:AcrR family transcriptional regulator
MQSPVKQNLQTENEPRRPRGRPRSAAIRRKILKAASALLNEGGIAAVTMEAIAARAAVGKPTIYREWPNAASVALAAFLESVEPPSSAPTERGTSDHRPPKRGTVRRGKSSRDKPTSPLEALRLQLRTTAHVFTTRAGRHAAAMIAASQNDSELAKVFRTQFILRRREEGRSLLNLAIAAGELRRDLDIEVALDLIYAPLYFRLLIGHGPLDSAFTDAILEHALNGLRVPVH